MSENIDKELGWEDEIQKDSSDFILLPEGVYDFRVANFERARHGGSEKLPPCNKAIIYIQIQTPEGATTLKHNLFLHTKTEGMLSAFFNAIGQKKHGEKLQMNWNAVIGSTGRCKVGVRKWVGDDGEERESNEVKKFVDPTDSAAPAKPTTFVQGKF